MTLKSNEIAGTTVITIDGNVIGGPDATVLNDEVHRLAAESKVNLVIDLGEVNFINSSGLGMLIRTLSSVRNAGGDLKLVRVSPKILNLLTVTKLNSVFQIFESVDEAIESFK